MGKTIQIQIANPCHESWDNMLPEERGRFCSSCKKSVIDFTGMGDYDVLQWVENSNGNFCGRFFNDQLNRNLLSQNIKKRPKLSLIRYFLSFLLVSSECNSQSSAVKPDIVQNDEYRRGENSVTNFLDSAILPKPASNDSDVFRGRIVDSAHGEPIPFAIIMISSRRGISADADGNFAISKKQMIGIKTLKIRGIGIIEQTIDVNDFWLNGPGKVATIKCQILTMGLSRIVVGGYIKSKKCTNILKDTLNYMGMPMKTLKIWPNPVNRGTAITLSMKLDQVGYTVQLYNMSGIMVKTIRAEINDKSENIPFEIPSDLPAGNYIVRLSNTSTNKTCTKQIVVL